MTEDLSYLDFEPAFECEIPTHSSEPTIHDEGGGVFTLTLHCPNCELIMSRIVCETYGVLLYIDTSLNRGAIEFRCPQCQNVSSLEEYRMEINKV